MKSLLLVLWILVGCMSRYPSGNEVQFGLIKFEPKHSIFSKITTKGSHVGQIEFCIRIGKDFTTDRDTRDKIPLAHRRSLLEYVQLTVQTATHAWLQPLIQDRAALNFPYERVEISFYKKDDPNLECRDNIVNNNALVGSSRYRIFVAITSENQVDMCKNSVNASLGLVDSGTAQYCQDSATTGRSHASVQNSGLLSDSRTIVRGSLLARSN